MNIEDIRKLHQKKYREEAGRFIVEGEHLVHELQKAAAKDAHWRDSDVYVTRDYVGPVLKLRTHVVTSAQMTKMSETRSPQGILAVAPLPVVPAAQPGERAIFLHEVQDPGNLGTILRTLAWFGAFRCLLSPNSVDPCNSKVVRASMGALFHVPVETDVPIESLPARFGRVASLEFKGRSIATTAFRNFDCFIFGNEGRGVPRALLDAVNAQPFTIAGAGSIESLNVATAANICQYELHRNA